MSSSVAIWDRLVRVLHWSLASVVIAAWLTGGTTGHLHERLGYCALAVVCVRVAWGFVGTHYARFTQFVRSLKTTRVYSQAVARGQASRHLGHNPLGGWMVLALLACVTASGVTGWLYTTDWLWGYAWLEQLHAGLAYLLAGLIGLHISGVLLTSWQHRENMVMAMITGRKRAAAPDDIS